MPYEVNSKDGRFVVTSPAGKKWKTTYSSMAGAKKAVDYIENRFGASKTVSEEEAEFKAPRWDSRREAW